MHFLQHCLKLCSSTPGCSGCIQIRSTSGKRRGRPKKRGPRSGSTGKRSNTSQSQSQPQVNTSQRGGDELTHMEFEVDSGSLNISQLSYDGLDSNEMNDVSSGVNVLQ